MVYPFIKLVLQRVRHQVQYPCQGDPRFTGKFSTQKATKVIIGLLLISSGQSMACGARLHEVP